MALADRDNNQADVPAASTTPAVDGFGLSHACIGLHRRADALDDGGMAVVSDPAAGRTRSTVLDISGRTCSSHAVSRRPATPCSPTGVPTARRLILHRTQPFRYSRSEPETSRAALVGPGRLLIIGRAGVSVETIDLELPDGATVAAQVEDGWFLIEAAVPSRRADDRARLEWRATSGEVSSSRHPMCSTTTRSPKNVLAGRGASRTRLHELHDAALAARARRTSDDPRRSSGDGRGARRIARPTSPTASTRQTPAQPPRCPGRRHARSGRSIPR